VWPRQSATQIAFLLAALFELPQRLPEIDKPHCWCQKREAPNVSHHSVRYRWSRIRNLESSHRLLGQFCSAGVAGWTRSNRHTAIFLFSIRQRRTTQRRAALFRFSQSIGRGLIGFPALSQVQSPNQE
jgi:hypothetical protein